MWARASDSDALLSPQSPRSFLRDFTYGLNPLRGCPFGCRDCYVQDLYPVVTSRDVLPDGQETRSPAAWGAWVEERRRAPATLAKALACQLVRMCVM